MPLFIKEYIIYWGSFFLVPIGIFIYHKLKKFNILKIIVVVGLLLFIWVRFIEINLIQVQYHHKESNFDIKIALIADTHLGVYRKSAFLKRVVKKINKQNADMLLIAGDFIYEPQHQDLEKLFAPLQEVTVPMYGVLGNHDVEKPGPPIREELVEILENYGVNMLNNEYEVFDDFTLVGLGSNWAGEDDITLLEEFSDEDDIVVLTHNPDTTLRYTNNLADFTFVGHTHCGQVRIPGMYKKRIPAKEPFDKGWYNLENTKLFITCGVGNTAIPIRFLNPPTIDIIEFKS